MKKILIVFLLLAGSVSASDYLTTRSSCYNAIRLKMGIKTSNTNFVTDSVLSAHLSEAIVTIVPMIKPVRTVDSFVTVWNQSQYALDTLAEGVQAVWFIHNDTIKPLVYSPIASWGEAAHDKTQTTQVKKEDIPSFYDFTDDHIFLYPVPHSRFGDTVKVITWKRVANVVALTSLSGIPEKYRVAIMLYAAWNVASSRQSPGAVQIRESLVFALQGLGLSLQEGKVVPTNK